jgi:hypothetical protein
MVSPLQCVQCVLCVLRLSRSLALVAADEQFAIEAYLADLARDGTVLRKVFDLCPLDLEGS